MPERDDEFYVGYLERSPPGIAAWTRGAAVAVLVLAALIAVLLSSAQSRFDEGVFEFGVERTLAGLLVERPYPMLLVPDEPPGRYTTHYLVGSGKRGADRLVRGLDGQPVQVSGSRIYNGRRRMIELHRIAVLDAGTVSDRLAGLQAASEIPLGRMTLAGEIVDSKCHLGVMKPGRDKPHKACAIRCISGGIPPVLRVQDRAGNATYLHLVSSRRESVQPQVLDFVAEPVEITGEVVRMGDLLELRADPETWGRFPGDVPGRRR